MLFRSGENLVPLTNDGVFSYHTLPLSSTPCLIVCTALYNHADELRVNFPCFSRVCTGAGSSGSAGASTHATIRAPGHSTWHLVSGRCIVGKLCTFACCLRLLYTTNPPSFHSYAPLIHCGYANCTPLWITAAPDCPQLHNAGIATFLPPPCG